MTGRFVPLDGECRGLSPCPNVPARRYCNVRSALITHPNGFRGTHRCSFHLGFMMEQPSFWDRNHDMKTIQEAPYACMFLFRGGSRGLDSPAPDDSSNETCIHLRTLVSRETIGDGSLYCKVDENNVVFPDNVPRQHIGFRETRKTFVHRGEIRESGASSGGLFAGTPFATNFATQGARIQVLEAPPFPPGVFRDQNPSDDG